MKGEKKRFPIPDSRISTAEKTIVVRLSPPGVGAVASLAIEGRDAAEIFSRRFQGNLSRSGDFPIFGRFRLDSGQFEEIVVHFISENSLEFDIHGGKAIFKAVESALCVEGAVLVDSETYISQKSTGNCGAAMRLLVRARTETTARILFDQYSGALERELAEIDKIRASSPEEAEKRLERLRSSVYLGKRLVDGFKVAIVGPPNVGKSSLMNAILGFHRVIVDHSPGTTRDIVETQTVINGWPFTFRDTAGIRETEHEIERLGVEKVRESLADSDLVLRIIDLGRPESGDVGVIEPGMRVLEVYNKCDISPDEWKISPPENAVLVSAAEGIGIDSLLSTIFESLIPEPPRPGEAIILAIEPPDY